MANFQKQSNLYIALYFGKNTALRTPLGVNAAFLVVRPRLFVPRLEQFEAACLMSLEMVQLAYYTALRTCGC